MTAWTYENEIVEQAPPDAVAFVYRITNMVDGRMYVGKKGLTMAKTKMVKGKKKKSRVESQWRKYFGSNGELQDDVKLLGPENFKREVVRWCRSKAEASYHEARLQFVEDVLLSDRFYNRYIICRINAGHLQNIKI